MIRTRSVKCTRCGHAWQCSLSCVACPECGENPHAYEVEGVPFCGLHEVPMLPCRITGQFLFTEFTDEFLKAWKHFPHAHLDGEPQPGQRTTDSHCCPVCNRLLQAWQAAHPPAGE